MTSESTVLSRHSVRPFWPSLLLCLVVVGLIGWLRLGIFEDAVVPLGTGLPLLLCLWNRRLRLLYGMAVAFTAITFLKVFVVIPGAVNTREGMMLAIQVGEIWILVAVIHILLNAMKRLEQEQRALAELNHRLEASNEELSASNAELAAREEEIARQNEELQSQTEELEQQAEELRQQAEEMEHQSTILQEANMSLAQREKGMQTLLESGRWLRADLSEDLIMNGVCQAATEVMGEDVQAATVVDHVDGRLRLRGDAGFGLNGPAVPNFDFDKSFAALVLERGQTGYVEDLNTRPDLEVPRPAVGQPFRSILACPIWVDGKSIAALEVFSKEPRKWSEQEFRLAEWLAAQAALSLQAIRFQKELDARRREAEETAEQKTAFLAAVSHDVRTPANAIGLLAELVERTAEDPEKVHLIPELARTLTGNARALIDLVSDVLDLARLDAGRIDLRVTDFCLKDLVRSEVTQAQPVAEKKGIELTYRFPQSEVWLATDRMKLARILSNLIGNAVKFTDKGSVTVECERTADGDVLVHVIDTGVGIPEKLLPRVFDEFFQLRNPERDREKGTGLGLAICRRLLDGLGCEISARSVIGLGSTFTLRIPAELVIPRPKGSADAPRLTAGSDSVLNGLRVLLVEDHDVTRKITAELMASKGAIVSEAGSGREALHFLNHGPHDVMLLDLNLPDLDGTEILKRLQISRPDDLTHVFAVSGDVRQERVAEVTRLGASGLIPKPLSVDHIVAALAERKESKESLAAG